MNSCKTVGFAVVVDDVVDIVVGVGAVVGFFEFVGCWMA